MAQLGNQPICLFEIIENIYILPPDPAAFFRNIKI